MYSPIPYTSGWPITWPPLTSPAYLTAFSSRRAGTKPRLHVLDCAVDDGAVILARGLCGVETFHTYKSGHHPGYTRLELSRSSLSYTEEL